MSRVVWLLVICLGGVAPGCEERQPAARRLVRRTVLTSPGRPDGGPIGATAAERAHDRSHRATLRQIHKQIKELFDKTCRIQEQGIRSEAVRETWPTRRERLLQRAGEIRTRALALDPLGRRSAAGRLVVELLGELLISLPDAVQESWREDSEGAFSTRRRDVARRLAGLGQYLDSL